MLAVNETFGEMQWVSQTDLVDWTEVCRLACGLLCPHLDSWLNLLQPPMTESSDTLHTHSCTLGCEFAFMRGLFGRGTWRSQESVSLEIL